MARDSISKEEKKKLKELAKEEKMTSKAMEKEERRRSKDEKRKSKDEAKRKSKEDVRTNDASINVQKRRSTETDGEHKPEPQREVRPVAKMGNDNFQFIKTRFVMPRGQKGYIFPVTPGPARYPVTRINYPIMKARRQVDLTKRMIAGPRPPAFTMGVRHSEYREFYNKIQ